MPRFIKYFACLILCIAYLSIGLYNVGHVGLTNDEIAHIGAIQSYTQGDGLNPEHPIFIKTIAATVVKLRFPLLTGQSTDQWGRGGEILFNGQYSPVDIIATIRTVFLLTNMVFLVWIYVYVVFFREISWKMGLIAGIIFVFSPSLISHNYLVTFDVSGAIWLLMATLSVYFFFKNLHKEYITTFRFKGQFLLVGLLVCAAWNTKFSNIVSVVPLLVLTTTSTIYFFTKRDFTKLKWVIQFKAYIVSLMIFSIYFLYRYSFGSVGISSDEQNIAIIKPLVGVIPKEFIHYIHGLNYILHRTSDGHLNFFGEQFTATRFPWFIARVFWFKENPVLSVLVGSGTIYGLYKLIKNKTYKSYISNFQRYHLSWFVLSVPLLYTVVSFNSELTIGFRHFYAVLVFVYVGAILFVGHLFDHKKYIAQMVLAVYVVFGLLSISQNISYVNVLWMQPKYSLANDSTLYWSQEQSGALQFLLEKGVTKYENDDQVTFAVWTSQFFTPLKVNEELALLTNTQPNQWKTYTRNFDPTKQKISEMREKYTVIDIHFIQKIVGLKKENEIAEENWKYIQNNKPIYTKNDVIWIYEKQTSF